MSSGLDCVECGGYISLERPSRLGLCRTCEDARRCTCPMRGSGDARGCLEVREYGSTPLLRPGDVLDGCIVVESVLREMDPFAECECACHE